MRCGLKLILLIGVVMAVESCGSSVPPDPVFEQLAGAYIEEYLQLNPESATVYENVSIPTKSVAGVYWRLPATIEPPLPDTVS